MSRKPKGDLPGQQVIQPDGSIGPAPAGNGRSPPLNPRQRFQKYAERRVTQVVKALRRFGNLANRQSYAYTDGERNQMLGAITEAWTAVRGKFLVPGEPRKADGFRFTPPDGEQ